MPPYRNGYSNPLVGALGGALIGMVVAWFTAMQSHGVSQKEMEDFIRQSQLDQEKNQEKTLLSRLEMQDYVKNYSPWVFDKQTIVTRLATQDQQIGELRSKIDLVSKYLEQQPKR